MVISQALALGVPVLATRHSGLPEQVVDGLNGFLVEEGDFAALAERILRLLEHPELVTELSCAARPHVAERYGAARLIEQQIAAYEELVAEERRRGHV